jgi:hypothetical protein
MGCGSSKQQVIHKQFIKTFHKQAQQLWQKCSNAKAWNYVAIGTDADNRNQTTGAVQTKPHEFSSKQLLGSLLEWLRKS